MSSCNRTIESKAGLVYLNERTCLLNEDSLAETFRHFLWVAGPKVAAGTGQLLANFFLIRSLGPERSGVVFVCITTIILSEAVFGSALDTAVLKIATSDSLEGSSMPWQIQKAGLIGKLTIGVALIVPAMVFVRSLARLFFHDAGQSQVLLLSLIAVFGLLILRSAQTCFQVQRRFELYGAVDILHSLSKFGGVGALIVLGLATPVNVLALYALVPLVITLVFLLIYCRAMIFATLSREAFCHLWSTVKWYLGTAIVGSTNSRMDILLVSALAGTVQAGLFSAAQVFVLPLQLAGMYLGVVFAPRIMPLWQQSRLSPVYHRFQNLATAGSLVCFAAAFLFAGKITEVLLPASFHGSRSLVLLLLPSALAALVNFPWTIAFLMFTHPRFLLILEISAFPVLIVLYRIFVKRYGAVGAASVTSAFAVIKTVLYQVAANRTLKRGVGASMAVGSGAA